MARKVTGSVLERKCSDGSRTFAARFQVDRERPYVTLGHSRDGMTKADAEQELANILADVRRGLWKPPVPELTPDVIPDPSFHEYASAWFFDHQGDWRENTRLDYAWQIQQHLLPYFANYRLTQITIAVVDAYRNAKVKEKRPRPRSTRRSPASPKSWS